MSSALPRHRKLALTGTHIAQTNLEKLIVLLPRVSGSYPGVRLRSSMLPGQSSFFTQ